METQTLLDQFHQRTEAMLSKAVTEWQNLPPQQLLQKPAPDRWSAAQCMAHLNVYGDYYLPAIETAIQRAQSIGSRPGTFFRSGFLGGYFTKLMEPDSKTKMKSPANAVPPEVVDSSAVLAQFIDQQEHLLALIDKARTVNLNQVRIPISIAQWIRLKLGDTFGFYIAHQERHVLQAERVIEG
jgi:DinB superfamily